MEHDFSSGDISSDDIDDFEEHHEHEPKIKQRKLEMIAFEFLKWYIQVRTQTLIKIDKSLKNFLKLF